MPFSACGKQDPPVDALIQMDAWSCKNASPEGQEKEEILAQNAKKN